MEMGDWSVLFSYSSFNPINSMVSLVGGFPSFQHSWEPAFKSIVERKRKYQILSPTTITKTFLYKENRSDPLLHRLQVSCSGKQFSYSALLCNLIPHSSWLLSSAQPTNFESFGTTTICSGFIFCTNMVI